MTRRLHLLILAVLLARLTVCCAQADELDRGHRVLLKHGLQNQAQVFYKQADVGVENYVVDPKPYLALAPCRQPAPEPLQEARAPDEGRRDR